MNWKRYYAFIFLLCTGLFAAQPVPDFSLLDVSLSSPRRGAAVSPRDYLMQVSGYYFGEAT